MSEPWLTTYTGKKFYPLNPRPEDIDILDIAHGLSNTCRYSGQCDPFYSVAEHSVRLAELVPDHYKMLALFHDTPEAYLTDIPSLVKPALSGYKDIELNLLEAILKKFAVTPYPLSVLRVEEFQLLATECRDLMKGTDDWHLPEPPLRLKIIPWLQQAAEREFLESWNMYNVKRGG